MAQLIYTLSIVIIFVLWFVCTIICQFKGKSAAFIQKYIDVLRLIPSWTFFAPRPGKSDYHVLYRDKRPDESLSEWTEVELSEGRNFFDFIWNPRKRNKKVLSDIIQTLIITFSRYPKDQDRTFLMYTFPYIMVLHLVTRQHSKVNDPAFRQFVLAESPGYLEDSDPNFILLSKFHELN
jgi:hypothetical protein